MSAEKAGPDKHDKHDKHDKPEKAEKAEKKKGQKGDAKVDAASKTETAAQASARSAVKARLRDRYAADVVPALTKEFGYKNIMAVPRVTKVVVNMGLGEGTQNAKIVDTGAEELGKITGQKAAITRSTKSISQFKLRKNMAIGAMVTLRGERMFEFLDRLIAVALPRVRDFRGVSPKGFDGRGNYTLGLRDQLMFPEIDYLKVDKARGMNISVVTTAKTDEEARRLLQLLGMPFRQN